VLGDLVTSYVVTDVKLATQQGIIRQLKEALISRIVIEQAKGVLAAERGVPVSEAFEMLRRYARNRGVAVRAVAAAVVDAGFRP
jgi:AmiR/NasT family two-component response regulator